MPDIWSTSTGDFLTAVENVPRACEGLEWIQLAYIPDVFKSSHLNQLSS
jgi:hypothetical protein